MSPAARLSYVLEALRQAKDTYVSGEGLASRLGLSRSAVWKYIKELQSLGYRVEAHPRLGYRLLATPDLMLPLEVQPVLRTNSFGRSMSHYQQAASTMELAWKEATGGAPEGHLVIAEEQTAGKGRLQRSYFCPAGGIWFSLVLRPHIAIVQIPPLSLVAAVGIAEGIHEATGLPVEVKWPNDLRVKGRKVAGILLEMSAEADRVHFLVLGAGINASIPQLRFPEELRKSATSLSEALGRPINRVQLLSQVLEHLERRYREFLAEGLTPALVAWRRMPNMLGQKVVVRSLPASDLEGVAEALDDDGALLVRDASFRLHRVLVGDVLLAHEVSQQNGGTGAVTTS